jgi:hypothetical protein
MRCRTELTFQVASRTRHTVSAPATLTDEGDVLHLVPVGGSDGDWYKDVLRTPTILLAAGGAQREARATPISDAAGVQEVLDEFRARYGAADVAAYYPTQDAAVEVPLA